MTLSSVSPSDLNNLKYFFSLALEDYIGNIEELLEMAWIDETVLWNFLNTDDSVEPAQISEIIRSLDLSQTPEEIGLEFLRRFPAATS